MGCIELDAWTDRIWNKGSIRTRVKRINKIKWLLSGYGIVLYERRWNRLSKESDFFPNKRWFDPNASKIDYKMKSNSFKLKDTRIKWVTTKDEYFQINEWSERFRWRRVYNNVARNPWLRENWRMTRELGESRPSENREANRTLTIAVSMNRGFLG